MPRSARRSVFNQRKYKQERQKQTRNCENDENIAPLTHEERKLRHIGVNAQNQL